MKRPRKSRRNSIALGISTTFHVALLALILSQAAPVYQTADSVAPPLDVQIVTLPEPPPPPIIVPHIPTPRPEDRANIVPPPAPPPLPTPVPTKSAPQPAPAPNPPRPTPAPPKPTPPQPLAPLPTPAPAPKPLPAPAPPAPVVAPAPAPPAPTPPAPAKPAPTPPAPTPTPPAPAKAPTPAPAAPAAPAAPMRLNIHKAEKDAPNTVPTLPFAPAPSASRPAGGAPAAAASGGEPSLGGSRLNGLTPYPYGAMPSGGSGLRGTLVGCANAEAVSLSAAERARCNERFGSAAGSAPAFDPMSPAKRAVFDKAAAAQEADRRYRSGMPTGTTSGKPGFGSGLGDDQPTPIRDRLMPHP